MRSIIRFIIRIIMVPFFLLASFLTFVCTLLVKAGEILLCPVAVFVLGCLVYYVFKSSWTNVMLLVMIEAGCWLCLFVGEAFVLFMESIVDMLAGAVCG